MSDAESRDLTELGRQGLAYPTEIEPERLRRPEEVLRSQR